jgi:peptidase E
VNAFFYGIGGGRNDDARMLQHHELLIREIRDRSGKAAPSIALLPTAHHNGLHPNLAFRSFFVERFRQLECRTQEILLGALPSGELPTSRDQLEEILGTADLLFVLNGDTRHLLVTVRSLELEDLFKESFARGLAFSGTSAGCIWLAGECLSDSEAFDSPQSWQYIMLMGLDILPIMNVHDDQPAREGQRSARSRANEFDLLLLSRAPTVGLAIPEFAAIKVDGGTISAVRIDGIELPQVVKADPGRIERHPLDYRWDLSKVTD